jgi:hypothetical protein
MGMVCISTCSLQHMLGGCRYLQLVPVLLCSDVTRRLCNGCSGLLVHACGSVRRLAGTVPIMLRIVEWHWVCSKVDRHVVDTVK